MKAQSLLELAAAHALGALEPDEQRLLESLAAADPEVRAELAAFEAVTSGMLQGLRPAPPPDRIRAQVLARIRNTPQQPSFAGPSQKAVTHVPADGFHFLRPAEGQWSPGPYPGTRIQVLSTDLRRNYMLLYIELEPGAIFPEHDHRGAEELFVVQGDLVTEGRHLRAGDFVHGEAGSHHHDLRSPGGCHALLLTPLTSALGEMAKAGLKRAADKVKNGLGVLPRKPSDS